MPTRRYVSQETGFQQVSHASTHQQNAAKFFSTAKQPQVDIEKAAYYKFRQDFQNGKFGTQRLGQAFYDTFKLQRMSNTSFEELYNADRKRSEVLIATLFRMT